MGAEMSDDRVTLLMVFECPKGRRMDLKDRIAEVAPFLSYSTFNTIFISGDPADIEKVMPEEVTQ